jgi:hypothetical protein
MRAFRILTCAVVALGLVGPAQAAVKPTDVSLREAKAQLREAFKRDFKNAFVAGHAKRIAGCRRASRSRVRCERISWVTGDFSYTGAGQIWFTLHSGRVFRSDAYTITRYDTQCVDRTPQNDCTRIFRAR